MAVLSLTIIWGHDDTSPRVNTALGDFHRHITHVALNVEAMLFRWAVSCQNIYELYKEELSYYTLTLNLNSFIDN